MKRFDIQTLESDLHRLELRFASLRMRQPRVVNRLARSIEQNGQRVPVVAVAEQENRWVLVDGYLRIEALNRLSRDTARVELWDCPLAQALLMVLVRVQGRTWEAIEEGAVIRELITRFELPQREVARQTGRDVSWVNRRLSLVQELPETLYTAICRGELSTWAASRVLVPLARANNDQAQTLLTALQRDPLSTRELHTWYQHYQKANHLKRQRMLAQPRLFCQALQAQTQEQAASEMRAGPEGAWLAELKRLTQRLRGLHRQLPLVFAGCPETGPLQQAWVELKTLFQDLDETLARTTHDSPRDSRSDSGPEGQGHPGAQDRPAAEALAQQRAPGDTPTAIPGTGGTGDANAPAGTAQRDLCAL
ncbi:MAG: ParB N-terminal domain-containing protein [Sulfitobacter sp.]|nr:ParB N-terminal domain-containing protein [Sulfitobacter sp.]